MRPNQNSQYYHILIFCKNGMITPFKIKIKTIIIKKIIKQQLRQIEVISSAFHEIKFMWVLIQKQIKCIVSRIDTCSILF